MDNRVWAADAIASPPSVPASPSAGYPTDGDPLAAQNATEPGAYWFHAFGEEMRAIIIEGGLTPNASILTQVRDAIKNIANGGDYKQSVRVASTAAINLAAPGANIDAVAMVAGDRFLEKDNATAANRGIYIWNGTAVPATRALDADTGAELNGGAIIPVTEGAVNADTNWQITNDGAVTIGTTGLTFQQIGTTQTQASIQGSFKNLQASATGLSANVTVTADEITVEDASFNYKTLRAVNLTVAGTASGAANGLDTGAIAASTWYSLWVIWNGTTTAGLLSLSTTAPTMPAGYTHKARVGWIRTDASGNKYPLSFTQAGRKSKYKIAAASNLTAFPQLASGVQGSPSVPNFVGVSVTSVVPPTASMILIAVHIAASSAGIVVAPNGNYGGYASTTAIAPISCSQTSTQNFNLTSEFTLEGSSIFVGCNDAAGSVLCAGWEDNI